jgi:adenine-specific DNA-methyltransferase
MNSPTQAPLLHAGDGQPQGDPFEEDPAFLREQLITYLGNKRALLPYIQKGVAQVQRRLGRSKLRCLDMFSGSGVVSRLLKGASSQLIVNDLEAYSYVTNDCYLTNRCDVNLALLEGTLVALEQRIAEALSPGILTRLYAPADDAHIAPTDRVFYTRRNAMYIDTARQAIAELPPELQKFFLAPLLAKASVHANTAGLFKAFYKGPQGIGQFGGRGENALHRIKAAIHLQLPVFSRFECDVQLHQRDANALVEELPELDLAYLDPPYNQHPYGSNYFMLNVILEQEEPRELSRVSGIPQRWNRSRYNRRGLAITALTELIDRCPSPFLLISYNSEGFLPQEQFLALLRSFGKVESFEITYNAFRGSRNLRGRDLHVQEFLFLLEKRSS